MHLHFYESIELLRSVDLDMSDPFPRERDFKIVIPVCLVGHFRHAPSTLVGLCLVVSGARALQRWAEDAEAQHAILIALPKSEARRHRPALQPRMIRARRRRLVAGKIKGDLVSFRDTGCIERGGQFATNSSVHVCQSSLKGSVPSWNHPTGLVITEDLASFDLVDTVYQSPGPI